MSDENPFAGAPRWSRKSSRDKSFSQNSHLWGNVPKNIVHVTPTPHMMKIGNETNYDHHHPTVAKPGNVASQDGNPAHGNAAPGGVSATASNNNQFGTNADNNKKAAKPAWKKFVIPAIIVSATVIAIAIVAIIIFVVKSHNNKPPGAGGQKPSAKSLGFVAAVPPVQQPISHTNPPAQPPATTTAQAPQQPINNYPPVAPIQTRLPGPTKFDPVPDAAADGLTVDEMISQLQAQKRLTKTVSLTPQIQDRLPSVSGPAIPLVTSTSTQNTRQMMEQLAAQQQIHHDTMQHPTDSPTHDPRADSDGPPLPLPAVRVSYEDLRKGTTTTKLATATDPTSLKRSNVSTNIPKQGQAARESSGNDINNSQSFRGSHVTHSPTTTVDLDDKNNARVAAAYLKAIADQLDTENHEQTVQGERTEQVTDVPIDSEMEGTTEEIGTVEEEDQVIEEEQIGQV